MKRNVIALALAAAMTAPLAAETEALWNLGSGSKYRNAPPPGRKNSGAAAARRAKRKQRGRKG